MDKSPAYLVTVVEIADGVLVPNLPPISLDLPEAGYVLYHVSYADGALICVWSKA